MNNLKPYQLSLRVFHSGGVTHHSGVRYCESMESALDVSWAKHAWPMVRHVEVLSVAELKEEWMNIYA
jgi:hypothetical protein